MRVLLEVSRKQKMLTNSLVRRIVGHVLQQDAALVLEAVFNAGVLPDGTFDNCMPYVVAAVYYRAVRCIPVLIKAGADLTATDNFNLTAVDAAKKLKFDKIAEILSTAINERKLALDKIMKQMQKTILITTPLPSQPTPKVAAPRLSARARREIAELERGAANTSRMAAGKRSAQRRRPRRLRNSK